MTVDNEVATRIANSIGRTSRICHRFAQARLAVQMEPASSCSRRCEALAMTPSRLMSFDVDRQGDRRQERVYARCTPSCYNGFGVWQPTSMPSGQSKPERWLRPIAAGRGAGQKATQRGTRDAGGAAGAQGMYTTREKRRHCGIQDFARFRRDHHLQPRAAVWKDARKRSARLADRCLLN